MSLKAQRRGLLRPQAPDLALAERQPRRQARELEVAGRPWAGAGAVKRPAAFGRPTGPPARPAALGGRRAAGTWVRARG
jgi:hypothetical protein